MLCMNYYTITKKNYKPLDTSTYILGIDPGKHTGLSVYNITLSKFECAIKTTSTPQLYNFFSLFFLQEKTLLSTIVIEDILANKPTFSRGFVFTAIKSKNPQNIAKSIGIFDKHAQDVGKNKRCEEICLEYFQELPFTVQITDSGKKREERKTETDIYILKVPPKKNSDTKMNHDDFKEKTGITTQLNEHTRDASMLIWNYLYS